MGCLDIRCRPFVLLFLLKMDKTIMVVRGTNCTLSRGLSMTRIDKWRQESQFIEPSYDFVAGFSPDRRRTAVSKGGLNHGDF